MKDLKRVCAGPTGGPVLARHRRQGALQKVGRTHRWARTSAACTPLLGGRLANRYHWRPTVRTHVVAYQAVECGFAGIGEQPGRLVLMARHSSTATMVHELGHNLGLGHSNSTRCSRAFGTACSVGKDSRRTVEYGDGTDVMGGGDAGGGTKGFRPGGRSRDARSSAPENAGGAGAGHADLACLVVRTADRDVATAHDVRLQHGLVPLGGAPGVAVVRPGDARPGVPGRERELPAAGRAAGARAGRRPVRREPAAAARLAVHDGCRSAQRLALGAQGGVRLEVAVGAGGAAVTFRPA